MADSKTVGREFLASVLAKISDPEKRAQAEAAFNSAEDAVAELGAGVLRQSDYSRNMDALKAKETEVTSWHSQLADWQRGEQARLEQALAEAEALKTRATAAPADPAKPTAPVVAGLSREEMQKEFDSFGNLALGVITTLGDLADEHMLKFGERLDRNALLKHPKARDIGLEGVYREVYKEKLDAKAKAADEARVKAIEDAAIAKYRAANPALPYPVSASVQPSTLDMLNSKADASAYSVDAAVAKYNELVMQKSTSSPGV